MRRAAIALITVLVLLSSSFFLSLGSSAIPNESGSQGLGFASSQPGIQVDSNGTVVVYGNAVLLGSYFTSQYDGHGAFFVSGNFVVESAGTLHTSNLSIVFVKNASFVNKGKVYMSSSIITSYNLSMRSHPFVTLRNYGPFTGNDSSLEFLGIVDSYSSTMVLTNGFYGNTGLSFQTNFQSSNLVLYNDMVYGDLFWNTSGPLGGSNLVSMNFTGGSLYSYDSFFNILTVPTNYNGKPTYPGGTIGLNAANAYFLNFSMAKIPSANQSYNFPIRATGGDAYFFDGVSVSLFSPEGYPVYNVKFNFSESSSSNLQSINTLFYGSPFTKEFAPYPSSIGQNTTIYGLVDIMSSNGLFVYSLYNLRYLGNNQTVHFPAFPIFEGPPLSLSADVSVLYVQVSNANVTHGARSNVQVNYSSDGSIGGKLSVLLGNQKIYSGNITTSPGVFVSIPVSFVTTLDPGNYSLSVLFSGTSSYAFAPVSVPVTIHQNFFAKLSLSSSYSLSAAGQPFAHVSVFVNVSGQFPSSTGLLNLTVVDSSGSHNFSSLIPIYSGMKSVFPFTVPVAEPGTSVVQYTASLTPILSYTIRSDYLGHLNQSLGAGLTQERYGIVQQGAGEASFYVNFSISSTGLLNQWQLFQNGIVVKQGNMTPGSLNVSIPVVSGYNNMLLELNGEPANNSNSSTSWNAKFNFTKVSLTGVIPPYIIENQSSFLHLRLSNLSGLPLNDLQIYVNNASVLVNSTNITLLVSKSSNSVQLYETILGKQILMSVQYFNSTVVALPAFTVSSAKSVVGNYHLAITIPTSGNVTVSSVGMAGVGASYSQSTAGNNQTFLIKSKFGSGGTIQKVLFIVGTYYSIPFNTSIPINVTILNPSYALEFVGSYSVQFGLRYVEVREINLNGTGIYEPASVTISGKAFYGSSYQHTFDATPNAQGIIKVPVPLNLGSYHVSARLPVGKQTGTISVGHPINVEILVLPFWGYIVLIVAIAAGAGAYSVVFVRRSHGRRGSERMFVCYNCGKTVPYDAKICPHCRVKFADQVKCGDCGSEIPRTMQYCPYCGNIMGQGFRLANYLKKKYRQYVDENRKEIEQSLGRVEDDVFWKRLAKGELPIKKFEDFRAEFLVSGKYNLKGVVQCPVCGSGNLISDDRCAICAAPMHLIIDYDRRAKGEDDGGKRVKGEKKE